MTEQGFVWGREEKKSHIKIVYIQLNAASCNLRYFQHLIQIRVYNVI